MASKYVFKYIIIGDTGRPRLPQELEKAVSSSDL